MEEHAVLYLIDSSGERVGTLLVRKSLDSSGILAVVVGERGLGIETPEHYKERGQ